jgi:hypothetical protein
MKHRIAARLAGLAALAMVAALLAPGATGAKAQRGLRAQLYLTQHRVPRGLSERGLIRFARGHRTRRLRETSNDKIADRKWLANMVIRFNRAPKDHEFQILYYDIEGGKRDFVQTQSIFVNDRSQKTYLQRIRMDRPQFKPNRKMELVVTVKRKEVGKVRFDLVGERKRRSGEVNFGPGE